jgi:MFS family permease
MKTLASTPGALRLLILSLAARLPLVMLGIGLLIHTARLTGSFGAAGVVTAAHALALGFGGPLLGRLVDRRGQTSVLVASASVAAALLFVVAFLPAGTPLPVLVALAAGIGLAVPPIGACTRSLLPCLLPDQSAARAVYAVEASAVELTWVVGPPLALGLGALLSTGAGLAITGLALLTGTIAFAAQPRSREWCPARSTARARGGAMRSEAMRPWSSCSWPSACSSAWWRSRWPRWRLTSAAAARLGRCSGCGDSARSQAAWSPRDSAAGHAAQRAWRSCWARSRPATWRSRACGSHSPRAPRPSRAGPTRAVR